LALRSGGRGWRGEHSSRYPITNHTQYVTRHCSLVKDRIRWVSGGRGVEFARGRARTSWRQFASSSPCPGTFWWSRRTATSATTLRDRTIPAEQRFSGLGRSVRPTGPARRRHDLCRGSDLAVDEPPQAHIARHLSGGRQRGQRVRRDTELHLAAPTAAGLERGVSRSAFGSEPRVEAPWHPIAPCSLCLCSLLVIEVLTWPVSGQRASPTVSPSNG
jgi:hypothetical protein